jgi:hypothetical protein
MPGFLHLFVTVGLIQWRLLRDIGLRQTQTHFEAQYLLVTKLVTVIFS